MKLEIEPHHPRDPLFGRYIGVFNSLLERFFLRPYV